MCQKIAVEARRKVMQNYTELSHNELRVGRDYNRKSNRSVTASNSRTSSFKEGTSYMSVRPPQFMQSMSNEISLNTFGHISKTYIKGLNVFKDLWDHLTIFSQTSHAHQQKTSCCPL
jgi:hypothetical protein